MSDNGLTTTDEPKSNQGAPFSSTPKTVVSDNGGARPRTRGSSTSSAQMLNSLDETILALTIENKRLEQEVLVNKNFILKSQIAQKDKTAKSKSIPTLKDLRSDPQVVEKAAALAGKVTHLHETESGSDSSETESDSDTHPIPDQKQANQGNDKPYVTFKDKQKRKAVSGEARASKDRVTFDVPWPHEYAQTKSINYQDRDFDFVQLIRGEVAIIHSVEKPSTSILRQKHLINVLYLVEKFPFCEIKDFHAEVLRSIERGHKSWTDSFSEEQARTLVSPVNRTKFSSSQDKPSRSPICGAYQAGNCMQTGDHFGSYGDKKLLHVCRKCVRKGKDPSDIGVRHPAKDCRA